MMHQSRTFSGGPGVRRYSEAHPSAAAFRVSSLWGNLVVTLNNFFYFSR
jgi:hypothetical protein